MHTLHTTVAAVTNKNGSVSFRVKVTKGYPRKTLPNAVVTPFTFDLANAHEAIQAAVASHVVAFASTVVEPVLIEKNEKVAVVGNKVEPDMVSSPIVEQVVEDDVVEVVPVVEDDVVEVVPVVEEIEVEQVVEEQVVEDDVVEQVVEDEDEEIEIIPSGPINIKDLYRRYVNPTKSQKEIVVEEVEEEVADDPIYIEYFDKKEKVRSTILNKSHKHGTVNLCFRPTIFYANDDANFIVFDFDGNAYKIMDGTGWEKETHDDVMRISTNKFRVTVHRDGTIIKK